MSSVTERIRKIVVDQLGVAENQVIPEAKLVEDLDADSLDQVELIMALEEEFGEDIPDEDAEKLTTVGEAIKYIEGKVMSGGEDIRIGDNGLVYVDLSKTVSITVNCICCQENKSIPYIEGITNNVYLCDKCKEAIMFVRENKDSIKTIIKKEKMK